MKWILLFWVGGVGADYLEGNGLPTRWQYSSEQECRDVGTVTARGRPEVKFACWEESQINWGSLRGRSH